MDILSATLWVSFLFGGWAERMVEPKLCCGLRPQTHPKQRNIAGYLPGTCSSLIVHAKANPQTREEGEDTF